MTENPPRRTVRWLWTALTLAQLAPVLAHGLWRPVGVAAGTPLEGRALTVTLGALALAAVGIALAALPRPGATARVGLAAGLGLVGGAVLSGVAGAVALAAVAGAAAALAPAMVSRLREDIEGHPRRHPIATALWGLMMAGAIVAAARVSTFVGDPALMHLAMPPGDDFIQHHLCFTAYMHAAELVGAGAPNIYDLSLNAPLGTPLPPSAAHMAPFTLDRYGYPPQFLLIPMALEAVVHDFYAQRAVWFGFNGLLLAAALWVLPRWVGRGGRVLLLTAPLVWQISLITLQTGNVHLTVQVVALLGMVAFARGRNLAGGALLAAALLSKIAPGVLGVVLLVRRQWAAAAATFGASVLTTGATLALVGVDPFVDFVQYHLPRIASGEAYDFIDDSAGEIYRNLAGFGIPFKLQAMGFDVGDPWAIAPNFSTALTVLTFVAAVGLGLRGGDRRAQLAGWLAVLQLGALRSPAAPPYVVANLAIALMLYGSELRSPWPRAAFYLGLAALIAALTPGVADWPMAVSLVAQGVVIGLSLWMALRRWPEVE